MTDAQERELFAYVLWQRAVGVCVGTVGTPCGREFVSRERFVEAMAQVEAETWEKVARKFDEQFSVTDHRLDNVRDYRVDTFYAWMAQQAKQAKEGKG